MSFAFRIKNPNGQLAVDDEFVNYAELHHGTFSFTAGGSNPDTGIIAFPATLTTPHPPVVVARWAANNNVFCLGYEVVGSPGAWTGFRMVLGSLSGTHPLTVTYRVFAPPTSSPGWALRTYRENQELCFSTGYTPMEIERYISPSMGSWTHLSTTRPAPGNIRVFYSAPLGVPGGEMALGLLTFGDVALGTSWNGGSGYILMSYGYGYGAGDVARLIVIGESFTSHQLSASDFFIYRVPVLRPRH